MPNRIIFYREANNPIESDTYYQEFHTSTQPLHPHTPANSSEDIIQRNTKTFFNDEKDTKKVSFDDQNLIFCPILTFDFGSQEEKNTLYALLTPLIYQINNIPTDEQQYSAIVLTSSTGVKALYQALIECTCGQLTSNRPIGLANMTLNTANTVNKQVTSNQSTLSGEINNTSLALNPSANTTPNQQTNTTPNQPTNTTPKQQPTTINPINNKTIPITHDHMVKFCREFPIIVVGEGTARTAKSLGFCTVFVPPITPLTPTTSPSIPIKSKSLDHQGIDNNDSDKCRNGGLKEVLNRIDPPKTNQGKTTSFNAVQLALFIAQNHHNSHTLFTTTNSFRNDESEIENLRIAKSFQNQDNSSILNHQDPYPVLLLSSKIRQDTLTNGLKRYNVGFREHLAYDTIPNCSLWEQFSTLSDCHGGNTCSTDCPDVVDMKDCTTFNVKDDCVEKKDNENVVEMIQDEKHKNNITFHVLFSPSGLQSIHSHLCEMITFIRVLTLKCYKQGNDSNMNEMKKEKVIQNDKTEEKMIKDHKTEEKMIKHITMEYGFINFKIKQFLVCLQHLSDSVFVSIGVTTENAFKHASIELGQLQNDLKMMINQDIKGFICLLTSTLQLLSQDQPTPCPNIKNQLENLNNDNSHGLNVINFERFINNFLKLSYKPLLTCVVPSPQGVREQVDMYLNGER